MWNRRRKPKINGRDTENRRAGQVMAVESWRGRTVRALNLTDPSTHSGRIFYDRPFL